MTVFSAYPMVNMPEIPKNREHQMKITSKELQISSPSFFQKPNRVSIVLSMILLGLVLPMNSWAMEEDVPPRCLPITKISQNHPSHLSPPRITIALNLSLLQNLEALTRDFIRGAAQLQKQKISRKQKISLPPAPKLPTREGYKRNGSPPLSPRKISMDNRKNGSPPLSPRRGRANSR
jgi:hypothetical protein